MSREDEVLRIAHSKKELRTRDIMQELGVSRQYAVILVNGLVTDEKLIKVGATNRAYYLLPEVAQNPEAFPQKISRRLKNDGLQEHEIYADIRNQYPPIRGLPENVRSILNYAFSEMLNNAIEHSRSKYVEVEVGVRNHKLHFVVNDFGIGVFRNVMREKGLRTEVEAMQDLLKGKTTTMPKSHSGQGIFFTSKAADTFILESYGYELTIHNKMHEVAYRELPALKRGTRVTFIIDAASPRHLSALFRKFSVGTEFAFNKTEIKVKLYASGDGVHVSRSQARRILEGLDKFESIILDFDQVPTIGQAFADEVFRVFQQAHPKIELHPINMNDAVRFMVERVEK
ncbi:MAG: DUF4325 domain-containing protein [Patescibacteria group bacterium]|nr:DUF4325 domain-containing protein [Patescibacteria group bacterium]MDE1944247.1 DUF4325 domain-containing protein [Patescibacteria group bacterium]MDE1945219.1 DUF4325 domain-containing protein [Patescibacteria group bacterium]MDE2057845.1 DUF4325 domain-containing protein [Patescibacteria group bacterium]